MRSSIALSSDSSKAETLALQFPKWGRSDFLVGASAEDVVADAPHWLLPSCQRANQGEGQETAYA